MSFDSHEKQQHVQFRAILTMLRPTTSYSKFTKIFFYTKVAFLQPTFELLSFKINKKFFIHNKFPKIGYHSRFYRSMNEEKDGNGEFLKNKVDFQFILFIIVKTRLIG